MSRHCRTKPNRPSDDGPAARHAASGINASTGRPHEHSGRTHSYTQTACSQYDECSGCGFAGIEKEHGEVSRQCGRSSQDRRGKEADRGRESKTGGETCEAREGLITEGQKVIDMDADSEVRDVGLINAAQKVEDYEIARYGGLCALAKQLANANVASTLPQTLEEQKRTDQKLTQLADAAVD